MNANPQNKLVHPMALRGDLEIKYKRSRMNLLLVILFTVVNLFASTFANTYFLFSATIPMLLPLGASQIASDPTAMADLGLPPEAATTLVIVCLVIGIVLTVPYLLCYIFSKKRVGWMIAALVLFSLDCLFLLLTLDLSMIADILVHAWVMFYLITGVINGMKLKNLPEELPVTEPAPDASSADTPLDTFNQADFSYDAASDGVDKGDRHVAKSDDE